MRGRSQVLASQTWLISIKHGHPRGLPCYPRISVKADPRSSIYTTPVRSHAGDVVKKLRPRRTSLLVRLSQRITGQRDRSHIVRRLGAMRWRSDIIRAMRGCGAWRTGRVLVEADRASFGSRRYSIGHSAFLGGRRSIKDINVGCKTYT